MKKIFLIVLGFVSAFIYADESERFRVIMATTLNIEEANVTGDKIQFVENYHSLPSRSTGHYQRTSIDYYPGLRQINCEDPASGFETDWILYDISREQWERIKSFLSGGRGHIKLPMLNATVCLI